MSCLKMKMFLSSGELWVVRFSDFAFAFTYSNIYLTDHPFHNFLMMSPIQFGQHHQYTIRAEHWVCLHILRDTDYQVM